MPAGGPPRTRRTPSPSSHGRAGVRRVNRATRTPAPAPVSHGGGQHATAASRAGRSSGGSVTPSRRNAPTAQRLKHLLAGGRDEGGPLLTLGHDYATDYLGPLTGSLERLLSRQLAKRRAGKVWDKAGSYLGGGKEPKIVVEGAGAPQGVEAYVAGGRKVHLAPPIVNDLTSKYGSKQYAKEALIHEYRHLAQGEAGGPTYDRGGHDLTEGDAQSFAEHLVKKIYGIHPIENSYDRAGYVDLATKMKRRYGPLLRQRWKPTRLPSKKVKRRRARARPR